MSKVRPDIIILNGERTFLRTSVPLPDEDQRIVKLTDEELEQKVNSLTSEEVFKLLTTTTPFGYPECHGGGMRGYIAVWEMKNDKLYLNEIYGHYKASNNFPLYVDWFTGNLRIPRGDILLYDQFLIDTYEEELELDIEKGSVVGSRVINNKDLYNKGKLYGPGFTKEQLEEQRKIPRPEWGKRLREFLGED